MAVGLGRGEAAIATSIALAESGGNAQAVNNNRNGSTDTGLWQINSVHRKANLTNPASNAMAMADISEMGRNWSPWVTYKTGANLPHLKASTAAVAKIAGKGDGYMDVAENLPIVGGAVGVARDGLSVVPDVLGLVGKFLASLTNPEFWKRLGIGAAGLAVVVLGAIWIFRKPLTEFAGTAVAAKTGGAGAGAAAAVA